MAFMKPEALVLGFFVDGVDGADVNVLKDIPLVPILQHISKPVL
jgi:hypothetical protein